MAQILPITTGEQAISATGAVTGTLDTSAASFGTNDYTLRIRVRNISHPNAVVLVAI
jgi:hypothetical protein